MDLLAKAEKQDGYRAACENSELNSLARQGDAYVFFPTPLQQKLQHIVDHYEFTQGSKIVTLHPSADSGFPHTRPMNVICMPATTDIGSATQTLFHEACHLSQRSDPAPWVSYSIRQGWWPVASTEIPEKWRERVRINPDTMAEPFWSWQEYYVPLPLFANEQTPMLRECDIRWFDRRNGVLYKDAPPSFVKRYGNIGQPEHPYEVSAIELSSCSKPPRKQDIMNILSA